MTGIGVRTTVVAALAVVIFGATGCNPGSPATPGATTHATVAPTPRAADTPLIPVRPYR